ncbi:MAG TPA: T9SS type A sorting domain-containing protein [Bacteroidia bacterium]|jgi:sugar lactone lactonase YvrE|nr:T9SS type A sorting domain-containing protein [Bacteroidia bacterium]
MKRLGTIIVCIFSLSLYGLQAQVYTISTYAGKGIAAFFGTKTKATNAELNYPCGVVSDLAGNIYIADYDNNRVRKVDKGDTISPFAGRGNYGFTGDGGPATSAEITRPTSVAYDKNGNIYIADYNNCRIRKVSVGGIITTIAGNGAAGDSGDNGLATAAQVYYPLGVAVDRFGNVFIAEGISNCIREINIYGLITTIAGNKAAGFSGDGAAATAAELNYPFSVAADDTGNIYIADEYNNRIRKVNTSGIITTVAGNGTAGYSGDGAAAIAAELNQPQGVAFDALGNMFITDYSNQRIRFVNTTGKITTIAGTGTQGFSGDGGAATAAKLYYPAGPVAIDPSGNVYIADQGNQRIRKLTPKAAGIDEVNEESGNVKVYPNPSHGIFQLVISNFQLGIKGTVEVYSITGEKIYSESFSTLNSQLSIDLKDKSAGIYLYRIISENGSLISAGKLVIE